MARVIAYHVVLCTHGFWLPNDPRESYSTEVRSESLRRFGPATTTSSRRSVAGQKHDFQVRRIAKTALKYPEVVLNGVQARSIAVGFGEQVAKCGYRIYACSILPEHAHLVVGRHSYPIEQVVRLLRQSATERLLSDGLHPFERDTSGRLPSVWAQDFWKVFLFKDDDIRRAVRYAEDNPEKEGKRRQRWSFVIPHIPWPG